LPYQGRGYGFTQFIDVVILRPVVSGAELANTQPEVGRNSNLSVQSDLLDLTHIISLFF
jgi:hypothetical protein